MKAQLQNMESDPLPRSLLLDSSEAPPRRSNATSSATAASEPTSAEAADLAPLNLKELERRCMGRIEFAERLLASFEQRFPVETAEITESFERADVARLARLVHQLKGSTANIGAVGLNRLLQRIEQVVHSGRLSDLPNLLDHLAQEWQRFQAFKRSLEKTSKL
jgi:HPt (histidine-containing phosphotransfer) domain-containing protein